MNNYKNYGPKKVRIGDNISIYINKDTPIEVIEWFNNKASITNSIVELVQNFANGQLIHASVVKDYMQTTIVKEKNKVFDDRLEHILNELQNIINDKNNQTENEHAQEYPIDNSQFDEDDYEISLY